MKLSNAEHQGLQSTKEKLSQVLFAMDGKPPLLVQFFKCYSRYKDNIIAAV